MCGILGHSVSAESSRIEGLEFSLAHRGPDAQNFWSNRKVFLGHARLSIIDLDGGVQPMVSRNDDYVITYNGEIYNYREIRDLLECSGHHFRTHSDTEVVLNAYIEWGRNCVSKLRGMFAFAIADLHRQKLFLARDHLGIKPLVYSYAGNEFSFSSEIQTLRKLPWVARSLEPDVQGVCESLRLPYTSAPFSAYKQILKLPPAHYLEICLDSPGMKIEPVRYWQFEYDPDESLSAQSCEEMVDATLRESVKAHLVSDVPFGAFLSGGLDSTLITSYMSEILESPVKTFNIGFEVSKFDERSYARYAAKILGCEHFEEVVNPNALDLIPKLISHYGEPFGDPSAIPTWYVSGLARERVPMVLTGDGADELFAGYWNHQDWMWGLDPANHPCNNRSQWKNKTRPILSAVAPWRFPKDPPYPRKPSLDSILALMSVFQSEHLTKLLLPEIKSQIDFVPRGLKSSFEISHGLSDLSRIQYVDIHNYLPNDILHKVDIASMMHGLEARTPFSDVRVAEVTAKIPWHLLIEDRGRGVGWTGKLPIRRILSRKFPPEFIHRKKMGFSIPLKEWLLHDPNMAKSIKEKLTDKSSRLRNWVNISQIKSLFEQEKAYQLWHLIVLDEWLEQNRF